MRVMRGSVVLETDSGILIVQRKLLLVSDPLLCLSLSALCCIVQTTHSTDGRDPFNNSQRSIATPEVPQIGLLNVASEIDVKDTLLRL